MMLKYSIEQLIHFTCSCGYHWTHSGPLPDWLIVCPKCNAVAYELEQVTDKPLIEAFSDEQILNEAVRRGYRTTPETDESILEMLRILKGRHA